MLLLAISAACAVPATAATKKPRQWPVSASTEELDAVDAQTYRPPQYIKSGKGGTNVVKKFVKINRQHSKEAGVATSKAVERASTTSLQYQSQSFVSGNTRPAATAFPTAVPLALSTLTTAFKLAATSRPSTAALTAATTPRPSSTSATASPFRRVLRTSGAGHKYFAAGGRTSTAQDSQPQASLLSKKSYTANQFVDDEDADDYFSRRRARFLFKSRVGK